MKDTPLSTDEHTFILNTIEQSALRLDARSLLDYRKVKIKFGETYGHAEISIGDTKALAQTSCEVVEPSANRPAEGVIRYHVELSPMAAPSFQSSGRPSDDTTEIQRIVERTLRDSRAIETESLCIVAGEKVWSVSVDITILDHDGNLADAAALAALASVVHFRRPHVDVIGNEFGDWVICDVAGITFAFFGDNGIAVVDPTYKEGEVSIGGLTVALNVHKEVCALQKLGGVALSADQLRECLRIAHGKAVELSTLLTTALKADTAARKGDSERRPPSLAELKKQGTLTKARQSVSEAKMDFDDDGALSSDGESSEALTHHSEAAVVTLGAGTAGLFSGAGNSWEQ